MPKYNETRVINFLMIANHIRGLYVFDDAYACRNQFPGFSSYH